MRFKKKNELKLILPATKNNIEVAIQTIDKFLFNNNITCKQADDIKVAVSEAFDNVVSHAYTDNNINNKIIVDADIFDNNIIITVSDKGVGIQDVAQAKTSLFTTASHDEHSGMGFTVMEQYSNAIDIKTKVGSGTKVRLTFKI
jgi:stage II sporulation protein AB (anti-sigma F factor)